MTMLIDMLKHYSFSSDIRVRIKSSFVGYSWKSEALSGEIDAAYLQNDEEMRSAAKCNGV